MTMVVHTTCRTPDQDNAKPLKQYTYRAKISTEKHPMMQAMSNDHINVDLPWTNTIDVNSNKQYGSIIPILPRHSVVYIS